ncbi:MAG TPA: DUF1974 domain-containing protein, partial [Nitrosomonas sp.]|nr:DUF1974 domain-containing protein [Nitrosomonas sp.]
PLLHWSIQDALYRTQQAFDEFLSNFPGHFLIRIWLRWQVFPLGKRCSPPSDELSHRIARLILEPGEVRERLTAGIYVPTDDNEPLTQLEQALSCAINCEPIEARLRAATKEGQLTAKGDGKIAQAVALNLISAEEAALLDKMKILRRRVIMVDDFTPSFD